MTPLPPKIKLAIVDDHKLFRKGIISLIELYNDDNYEVLLEAENGNDLIKQLDNNAIPDIIIMDIEMPERNGYETVACLSEQHPDIKILVVSQVDCEEAIIRMLRLGVKGYLSKNIEPEELHSALQAVHHKGYYYTDFITGKLIYSLQQETKQKPKKEQTQEFNQDAWRQLNEREKEFLEFCCSEQTYEQIAKKMFLSPKTIDGYRNNLFEKFGVGNRVGLVLFAIKNGLVKI
jgi:two-component system, NarL family, invasion response regulator UvrY